MRQINKRLNSFIRWYYNHFEGRDPDASEYAGAVKRLAPYVRPKRGYTVYRVEQLKACLLDMESQGVDIQTIGILTMPRLLSDFVHRPERFKETVRYLTSKDSQELPDGFSWE